MKKEWEILIVVVLTLIGCIGASYLDNKYMKFQKIVNTEYKTLQNKYAKDMEAAKSKIAVLEKKVHDLSEASLRCHSSFAGGGR